MRSYFIIALSATLAYAKPQYNYPAPAAPSIPTGSYGAPVSAGFGSSTSAFAGSVGIPSTQGVNLQLGGGSAGFGGFGGSSVGFAPVSQATGGGTLVQKHIYVHVAPPEPEEVRPQRPISAGQSTKHYKIIFIKAPSYDLRQQQILQAQAQNEEKTLVYVLVKKPDDVADITVPTAAPTAPSKPEVYFIRYKAKSEATAHAGSTSSVSTDFGGQISGGGSNLAISGSNLGLTTGTSSGQISIGRPSTNYGPPGQSGPY